MRLFSKHPKGLSLLFFTEMAERFSYYGMRSLFVLFMVAVFFNSENATQIYGSYAGLVYLTPLLGGWIAGRYWGNRRSVIVGAAVMCVGHVLMFISACLAQQSIFVDPSQGGTIDTSVDNTLPIFLMFSGLAVLIVGNGFFKPNLASMVGDLYPADELTDTRRDSAYTIYYMGVNVGALLAPLVCGLVSSDGRWDNPGAFKWAFLCSAIAMLLGLLMFVLFKNKMLISADGKQIGLPPKSSLKKEESSANKKVSKNSPWMAVLSLALAVGLFLVFSVNATNFNDYITAMVYATAIALPVYIISDRNLTRSEKVKIGVIYIIAAFVVFFWAAYEQAGTSLTIFADRNCDRMIGSWEVPTAWFQSINPVAIVVLAPIMAILWEKLAMRKLEPSSPAKQAIGLLTLAIGYVVIAYGTHGMGEQAKASMWWLVALYVIHTIAELCLSPIGQSLVYKLSPSRLVSLLMGVWFMSISTSNVLAGSFATLLPQAGQAPKNFLGFEITTLSEFFLIFAVMAGIASIILFAICPLLKRMMAVHEQEDATAQ